MAPKYVTGFTFQRRVTALFIIIIINSSSNSNSSSVFVVIVVIRVHCQTRARTRTFIINKSRANYKTRVLYTYVYMTRTRVGFLCIYTDLDRRLCSGKLNENTKTKKKQLCSNVKIVYWIIGAGLFYRASHSCSP